MIPVRSSLPAGDQVREPLPPLNLSQVEVEFPRAPDPPKERPSGTDRWFCTRMYVDDCFFDSHLVCFGSVDRATALLDCTLYSSFSLRILDL